MMQLPASIVLLSGGLDSTVAFAHALRQTEVVMALTFDYGQRAAKREIEAAKKLCNYYNIQHETVELPYLRKVTSTALVNREQTVPALKENELGGATHVTAASAAQVWVPNRNGLFINIAACYAEAKKCDLIITGFNREEAATFPDNSADFVEAVNQALFFSTLNHVKVVSYTQNLTKREIIQLGQQLGVPFNLIWSCYLGETKMCGECESCLRLLRAMRETGNLGLWQGKKTEEA